MRNVAVSILGILSPLVHHLVRANMLSVFSDAHGRNKRMGCGTEKHTTRDIFTFPPRRNDHQRRPINVSRRYMYMRASRKRTSTNSLAQDTYVELCRAFFCLLSFPLSRFCGPGCARASHQGYCNIAKY